jgi:RIO-like serine/threonine protein kinase
MTKRLDLTKADHIKTGVNSLIYPRGNRIIKVRRGLAYFMARNAVEEEYKVHQDLYDLGINVPEPHGIIKLRINGLPNYGLEMDLIKGINLSKLNLSFLYKRMEHEVQKAEDLGFNLIDRFAYNAMVNRFGKVFLIDFEGCKSPKN